MTNIKRRIFQILEIGSNDDQASRKVDLFIITLIFLNALAVILGTVEELAEAYAAWLQAFEVFSIAVFTVEYLLRLWTCTIAGRFQRPVTGRLRYALTPFALVDLMAILPFYLPLAFGLDLRFVRVLRLLRLVRLIKLVRYTSAMKTFGRVLRESREELVITVSAVLILLVFASSTIYLFEHGAQPEAFSSIPQALWWGVATITTVGYGDVYPVTGMGKLFGGLVALLGIGIIALPAGILASGFTKARQAVGNGTHSCPHCGRPLG